MSNLKSIRILSIEDHPVFRQGLSMIISSQPDMSLVGQASTAIDGMSLFSELRPDVTLLDMRLPDRNGIEVLLGIRAEAPAARVLVLTTFDGDGEIRIALRAGASGYALKSMPQSDLLSLIRSIHAGHRTLPADVTARLDEFYDKDHLTQRELEVLRLIRDGNRNKEIAHLLSVAETTINFHIKNAVDKLGANDRTHAVMIAVRRGFLQM